MTDQKRRRVFSAVLSGIIMLIMVLFTVIVYQVVGIVVRKNRIKALDKEIAQITLDIQNTQSEIESWGYDWKIELAERESGLYESDDE